MDLRAVLTAFDLPAVKSSGTVIFTDEGVFLTSPEFNAFVRTPLPGAPPGAKVDMRRMKTALKYFDGKIIVKEHNIVVSSSNGRMTLPFTMAEGDPMDRDRFSYSSAATPISKELLSALDKCAQYTAKDGSSPELTTMHIRNGAVEASNRLFFISSRLMAAPANMQISTTTAAVLSAVAGLAENAVFWSQEDKVVAFSDDLWCEIPQQTSMGTIPEMNTILKGIIDGGGQVVPLSGDIKTLPEELALVAAICAETGEGEGANINMVLQKGRVVLSVDNPQFSQLTRTISCDMKPYAGRILVPVIQAAALKKFICGAFFTLYDRGQDTALLKMETQADSLFFSAILARADQ